MCTPPWPHSTPACALISCLPVHRPLPSKLLPFLSGPSHATILPENDLMHQHEPLKIVLTVWGVGPAADASFPEISAPPPPQSGECHCLGPSLPLFLVAMRRKEDFSCIRLQWLENKHHPSLASPLISLSRKWGPGSLGFQVSSEQFQSQGMGKQCHCPTRNQDHEQTA